jgi:hypothetical protein
MIDRQARDRMASALRSYMDERITAFQFDQTLEEVVADSNDTTAKDIREMLWFHYDDCTDHQVVASKEQWDFFNRLLLLLESDGELPTEEAGASWQWGGQQAIALVCVGVFGFVVGVTGFGEHLFVAAIPLGGVSMLIAWWGSRSEPGCSVRQQATEPFGSVGELLAVRRRHRGFKKSRYRKSVGARRVRTPLMNTAIKIPQIILWLILSPVVLVLQALPERRAQPISRIAMSRSSQSSPAEER